MSAIAFIRRRPAVGSRRSGSMRSITTYVCVGVLAVLVVCALLGPAIAPHDPLAQNLGSAFAGIDASHVLGSDAVGRDIFSRLVVGSRTSLAGPLLVVLLAGTIGIPLGIFAGYRGGLLDGLLARGFDLMFAFPTLLLAIVAIAVIGTGFWPAVLVLAVGYAPLLGRVARSLVLVEREQPYVAALELHGMSALRIAGRHIVPNVGRQLLSQVTVSYGYALLDLAALSFLGLGVQPPTADWGVMLASGREGLAVGAWLEVVSAAVVIAIAVLSVNLLGDRIGMRRDV